MVIIMKEDIQIIEKPDWVSWDDIKRCLFEAHATNRKKGINMAHYQWTADKIRDSLGDGGIMLVALDGKKVVGTAAIAEKNGGAWYANGRYAYMCFAGVLPDYGGNGIYKNLVKKREEIAELKGYHILLLDTHYYNKAIQEIAMKNGYRLVRFFRAKSGDHYSVVMVKWLHFTPYSSLYCRMKYSLSKIRTIICYPLNKSNGHEA